MPDPEMPDPRFKNARSKIDKPKTRKYKDVRGRVRSVFQAADRPVPAASDHRRVDSIGTFEGAEQEHTEHPDDQAPGYRSAPTERPGAAGGDHPGELIGQDMK